MRVRYRPLTQDEKCAWSKTGETRRPFGYTYGILLANVDRQLQHKNSNYAVHVQRSCIWQCSPTKMTFKLGPVVGTAQPKGIFRCPVYQSCPACRELPARTIFAITERKVEKASAESLG